jgi:hypothetical protein
VKVLLESKCVNRDSSLLNTFVVRVKYAVNTETNEPVAIKVNFYLVQNSASYSICLRFLIKRKYRSKIWDLRSRRKYLS